jgi:menaquinone-9 beta-reductase
MNDLAHPVVETDVLVVGGGPAGLAAAIASRRKGLRVMVVDGGHPPIDKACGEGLMPEAVRALAELGVRIPAGTGGVFRGVRFVSEHTTVEAICPFAYAPSGHGLGLRRTVLHQILVDAAIEAGVELRWNTPVTGLTSDGAILGEDHVTCRWLIGADGGNSHVRRWASLDRRMRDRERFGFRVHFQCEPWADKVEVYWHPDFQIYVTPTGVEEICVALLCRDPHMRVEDAVREFPELHTRLQGATRTSSERGGISATRKLWAVAQGNIALIGDASGSVDAITGEGVGLAFQQALLLADALAKGDLVAYEKAHRRLARRPTLMADLMLLMDGRPNLQYRVLDWLSRHPGAFRMLLALHVGQLGDSLKFLISQPQVEAGSRK